jgi:WD40 repeat protein/tetratricopeptide (TPR) repeat protein
LGGVADSIPGYVIENELGRGGMGVVYKAWQVGLNRPVALKMVLSGNQADPRELVRFLAEAEAVAAVRHPNVVQVYGYGEHAGRPYIAMEYLDAGSLADVLRTTARLTPRDAAALVERLAKAVQAAHDLGIVHRDLKPANILFAADGGSRPESPGGSAHSHHTFRIGQSLLSPKVTDFGLAKRGSHDLTRTGAVLGTPSYMAPEQAKGQTKFVGPAADVYALGAILYECLAGTVPFRADDTVSLIMKVAEEDPDPVRMHAPEVPRDLDLICLKCLAKDPKKRYPTAAALADDLRRFQDGDAITARPATFRERSGRWIRKNPARATGLAAVLAFVAAGVGLAVYNSRLQRQRADELQVLSDQAIQSANTAREQKAAADAAAVDARKARDAAQTAEQAANEAREDAVDQLYAASIDLAYREWQQNNVYRAEQLLNETPATLRGWEWRFLKSLTRQERHILRGHVGSVNDLAVSADGTRLVSADGNWTSRSWDLTSGRELLASDSWGPLVFSPDNQTALIVVKHQPKLVGQSDGRLIHAIPVDQPVAAVFVDGGKHVVILSGQTGQATKWSVGTGQKVAELPAKLPTGGLHTWAIGRAKLSADGTKAAFRTGVGQIDVWDLAAGKNLYTFQGTPMHSDGLAFQPGGPLIAGGFMDGTAYVWDITTKKEVLRIHAHDGAIHSMVFSPDGKRLATAGADTAAKVWDVGTGTELAVFRGHTAEVHAVVFTPDGKQVVTGSADRTIRVWDLTDTRHLGSPLTILSFVIRNRTREELPLLLPQGVSTHRTYYGHLGPTRGLVFAPYGRRIATTGGGGDRAVNVWDLDAHKELQKYGYYSNGVGAAAFSRDGKRIAAVGQIDWQSNPGRLFVYEDGRDEPVMKATLPAEGKADSLPAVTFSPDGQHVVVCLTGGTSSRVRVFEVASGKEAAVLPLDRDAVHSLAFTPDGKRLVVGAASRVRGYDWPARTVAFDHPANLTRCLAVGPNGRIAVGYEDSRIDLFDPDGATNRIAVKRLEGHVGPVLSVAFSPDGSRLVSSGNEMAVKIWNAKTGRELLTFRDHAGLVTRVDWSPDGRRIASCGYDALKVWTVPAEDKDSTESWKLLYSERFDDPAATKGWKKLGTNWAVEDGALRGVQQATPGSSATWAATVVPPTGPLPQTVEVRYTMWSPAPKIAGVTIYNPRADLSIQPLFGAPGNRLGRLGAFVLVVQKSKGGMADSGVPRDKYKFEPNRKYHVRVLRDKTRLSVTVNGEHVLNETVVAGEAPVLTLSSSWGEAGDSIYFDDIEVRAPEAAVAERKLLDRFDAWCDEYLVRELVAEKVDRSVDLAAADKQFLKAQLPAFTENSEKILAAVSEAVYRQHPTPDEAAITLRQAIRVTQLDPGNWTGLSLRGLAEYRAGRYDAAEATLKAAHDVHTRTEGSAAPWPLATLALVNHKKGRPDEAGAWLRRAKDLIAGGAWVNAPSVAKLIAEADAAIAPPPDQDGDAIRELVFTAQTRGWNHADLGAYLSAFADDARVTTARLKAPSDHDVTFDKTRLAAVRAVGLRGSAAAGYRTSFENVSVRVAGDRAEMSFTATSRLPGFFLIWAHDVNLRRTPAGWKIMSLRDWPSAMKSNTVVTEYTPEYFRKADATAEEARRDGDGAKWVQTLLRSRRYKDALPAAREQANKPDVTADDRLRLAEAAFQAGEVDEMWTAFRAALAAKPDLEMPWFLSRLRTRLPVSSSVLYGLALHPSRPEAAAGGQDENLHTWNLTARKGVRSDPGHTGNISDVQYSPDGARVATVGDDGRLIVRDASTGAEVWNIIAHQNAGGTRLAYRPAGRHIISVGWDRAVKVWDADTGKLVRELPGHRNSVLGVAWSAANPRRVASASYDGTVRVWDPETGVELWSVSSHGGRVGRVAFSPDGKSLASTGDDGTVRLWDAETGAARATLKGHVGQVEPVAFTPDGQTLLTGGTRDGKVMVWDVPARKLREVIRVTPNGGVYGLVVSPDGKSVLTSATDGSMSVWSLEPW